MDVSTNETWLIHNKERVKLSMLTFAEALRASGITFEEAMELFSANPRRKIQSQIPKEEERKVTHNCANCGAPLTYSCVCEYCGTVY